MMRQINRGEVYFADLSPVVGSEQGGCRPVLVIQNDIGNRYSSTVIVIPLTKKIEKNKLPTHVEIDGLSGKSIALCEQIKTIDKKRIGNYVCNINIEKMIEINRSIAISIGLWQSKRRNQD